MVWTRREEVAKLSRALWKEFKNIADQIEIIKRKQEQEQSLFFTGARPKA